MKKSFFSCLVICVLCLVCSSVYAEKVEISGIYYNLNSDATAEVTYRGDDEDGWMYFNENELYTGDVVIPSSIVYNEKLYSVTSIGADAFAGSKQMTSLSIARTVQSIGSGVFSLCNNLRSISVENGNTVFVSYDGVLYAKNPMRIFFVPKSIQGDIALHDDITEIPSSAFQNCTKITTITFPDNVTKVGDGAFNGCNHLEEIFFNDKLKTIGVQAFSQCSALQIVSFPESLVEIGNSAFVSCPNLLYVLIKEGLKTIGEMAFYNCGSLYAIQLPSTLQSIGEKAFYECVNLATIKNDSHFTLEKGSTEYGYVAYYATEIIQTEETPEKGFQYVSKECKSEAVADQQETCLYRFDGDNLIVYGQIIKTCAGERNTAEIINLGDTIKIPTYEYYDDDVANCLCVFDYEITIPNVFTDSCVVVFRGWTITAKRTQTASQGIDNQAIKIWQSSLSNQIFIEMGNVETGFVVYELFSAQGQLLERKPILSTRTQIDMPHQTGTYFVRVIRNGRVEKTGKFSSQSVMHYAR